VLWQECATQLTSFLRDEYNRNELIKLLYTHRISLILYSTACVLTHAQAYLTSVSNALP